jgi:23S rRNA pseudouridine2605 synthase
MRLNVYLQRAGAGSRRDAEWMIAEGRVQVNGQTATATVPVHEGDTVTLDGEPVVLAAPGLPRLFLLHKPLDYLVTARDPEGRPTIFDLDCLKPPRWPKANPRLVTVGRLDINSEGLLVLASDGALAEAMMNPRTGLARVYRVRVHGRLPEAALAELRRGVEVNGISYRGAEISEETEKGGASNTWYRVTLTEGRKREVRRMFRHFGCQVNRLIRLQYGPFGLGDLKAGEIREVPPHEVRRFVDSLHKAEAQ